MLRETENIVYEVLSKNKRARKDDFILYGAVIKRQGVDLNQSVLEFLAYAKERKMPSFETVSRCRRKLQAQNEDLVDLDTKEIRMEQEQEFLRYVR